MKTIAEEVTRIKNMRNAWDLNEATAKQRLVLPVLRSLGWSEEEEIELEYSVEGYHPGKVDIALLTQGTPQLFVEAKTSKSFSQPV